jgi:L-ribulose-5-phosphate 4-epimerase
MMLKRLKQEVLEANLDLVKYNLVSLKWGNVSGISREEGFIVIKPSGIDYKALKTNSMVVVDLEGHVVEGMLRPSSDLPTHLELYKAFPQVGGIAHSHSIYATSFSQACKEIPCYGTTHADAFFGAVPLTRLLTKKEVGECYERNTGKIIVERFHKLDPMNLPGVLVAGHAPFTWGRNPDDAVINSYILEQIALMTIQTLALNPNIKSLPKFILKKHYQRKHGPKAYYGQQ